MNQMLDIFRNDIRRVLKYEKEWDLRHFIPSCYTKTPDCYNERLSIIEDNGLTITIYTNIDHPYSSEFPLYYKRYWDSLFDWECLGKLGERNDMLLDLSKSRSSALFSIVNEHLSKHHVIVHPEDMNGWKELNEKDQVFMKLICIYNVVPPLNYIEQDLQLFVGVGKVAAHKLVDQGIYMYEDLLLKNDKYVILLSRCNISHINVLFYDMWVMSDESLSKSLLISSLVGSLGRAMFTENPIIYSGHDIDLLFHERYKEIIVEVLEKISIITFAKEKSYCVNCGNTLCRVDINFFSDEDEVTQRLHFMGPASMNKWMRFIASKKGYKLNQYSLTRLSDNLVIHPSNDEELFSLIGICDPRPKYFPSSLQISSQ